ncbi:MULTISPECIES: DUF3309 family protein [unclassified Xanthobacter]|uniref:DUF3309 family protein n=1 Tax=unclassified Xanthobacter TaxID=2623496 RepID=UPI001EDFF3EE|nr:MULTISPECIES: DUF3309 family protein [unclassified Xanthobacter]
MAAVLIIVLVILTVAALPTWNYSARWGYAPGGAVGALLLVVAVLTLTGWL